MAEEETQYKAQRRVMPTNDLQFYTMTTNPAWGDHTNIPHELLAKLSEKHIIKDENGKDKEIYVSKWGELSSFTRDLRLGNLSYVTGELGGCQYSIDLANDFLREDFSDPFLILYSRAAAIIELSQSKGGFFRRIAHTFRQEHFSKQEEVPKKSLFGVSKQNKY